MILRIKQKSPASPGFFIPTNFAIRFLFFRFLEEKYLPLPVFIPALNRDITNIHFAESIDKGTCQPGIGDERDVKIDGISSNPVAVSKFAFAQVFGDVDNQVDFLFPDIVQGIRFHVGFVGPV